VTKAIDKGKIMIGPRIKIRGILYGNPHMLLTASSQSTAYI